MTPTDRDTAARRAKLAFGFALVVLLFLAETLVADRVTPNPASPWVWGLLGSAAVACLSAGLWLWRVSKRG